MSQLAHTKAPSRLEYGSCDRPDTHTRAAREHVAAIRVKCGPLRGLLPGLSHEEFTMGELRGRGMVGRDQSGGVPDHKVNHVLDTATRFPSDVGAVSRSKIAIPGWKYSTVGYRWSIISLLALSSSSLPSIPMRTAWSTSSRAAVSSPERA